MGRGEGDIVGHSTARLGILGAERRQAAVGGRFDARAAGGRGMSHSRSAPLTTSWPAAKGLLMDGSGLEGGARRRESLPYLLRVCLCSVWVGDCECHPGRTMALTTAAIRVKWRVLGRSRKC